MPRLHLFEGFGVEIEYMLVDARTLDTLPVADRLLAAAGAAPASGDVERGRAAWSNELTLHVLEMKTNGPAPRLEPLPELFQGEVVAANALLAPLGGRLCPSSMHPWMDPFAEMRLWPHENGPIYQAFDRLFDCRGHGWANLQSTHLNLPFGNDEEFGRLHAAIRLLLPLLPALAASSPVLEGRLAGRLDQRMAVYRGNAAAVPSVAGQIVPEPVFTARAYRQRILGRIYRDLLPHDPQGVLRHEWVNARGAIARFDRSAIEIRVLDTQECPLADLAVCALVAAVVRELVAERWGPAAEQRAWDTDALAGLLSATIEQGEQAAVDPAYAAALGWRAAGPISARALWRHLADEVLPAGTPWDAALDVILEQGCLARRILAALGPRPGREDLARVWGELCACLAEGRMFA